MKEIEVFILTRNRFELLKCAVESILNQTHKVHLTIVDNDSSDETENYINELMKANQYVHYFKQPEFVPFGKNLDTAQKLAKADYVMFFHDDDVLHPQYIETAYRLINKYDNVDIVCGLLTTFCENNEIEINYHDKIRYSLFKNKVKFVSHCYSAMHTDNSSIMFPHVIYKTDNVKNINIDDKLYGKIADKPFVIDSVKNGICIQIRNRDMLMYRIHSQQDSATSKNGPFTDEIFYHNKKFMQILNSDLLGRLIFNVFSYDWLMSLYAWGNNGDTSTKENQKQIIKLAYENKAINKYAYNLYFGFFRFLYKKNHKILKKIIRHFDKHIKEYELELNK